MVTMPSIMEAQRDAKEIMKMVSKGWNDQFETYCPLYNIANEDVKTYVNAMGTHFDTALCVGSAGDQGIALSAKGAKDVYFFDINRVDIYFLALKKVALCTLKRKDFLDFMIAENSGIIMEYRIYNKIKAALPTSIRVFWDMIYEYFSYNAYYMSEELFRAVRRDRKIGKTVNDYLSNNEKYYAAREGTKNSRWHFMESDLYSLDKHLPEGITYDGIILSNLYEYLNFGLDMNEENARKYVTFIKNVLMPKLRNGGSMMAAYLCRYDEDTDAQIKQNLIERPNEWIPSADYLVGPDALKKYFTGYTGQNVSYHYLLNSLGEEIPFEKVPTTLCGYGMSDAKHDTAILIHK